MRLMFVLLLLPLAASAGSVYKWTDQNGVAHYTDRPIGPEEKAEMEGVKTAEPPPRARKDADEPVRIPTQAELQGVWCEFELYSDDPEAAPLVERIEWTFIGKTLQYRDLDAGITLRGDYAITDGNISVGDPAIGSHRVRSFFLDAMELMRGKVWYRLRRGRC
ncbi:MAG: DUF4124 domain-containing protein [Xanthomonadales bacterium PRO6]|nr:hypothetical protein [Xanthomonadales bacterium]MCE7932828.1 DUF4124 domain-containing protein [Xanthomonadales bacterium PRO6]